MTEVWKPERAVQIVAGTPPGGGLDRVARALAKAIAEAHLVEVLVEVVNVPGDRGLAISIGGPRRRGSIDLFLIVRSYRCLLFRSYRFRCFCLWEPHWFSDQRRTDHQKQRD